MKVFKLSDLGADLQDAEIVEWHVTVGDEVAADQPLMTIETEKATLEVPAPFAGKIARIAFEAGDVAPADAVLVEFEGDPKPVAPETDLPARRRNTGTVVGEVEAGDAVLREAATPVGRSGPPGVKATPAVEAPARRRDILAEVKGAVVFLVALAAFFFTERHFRSSWAIERLEKLRITCVIDTRNKQPYKNSKSKALYEDLISGMYGGASLVTDYMGPGEMHSCGPTQRFKKEVCDRAVRAFSCVRKLR